ncbi:hypothetical protein GCM10022261_05260 [Brevibacterium daeguense]|uniref:Uncharacterized protein n=1 Tax=Brevibacterium daeguense TaxID=909936 RepID=A0ABP8EGE8_9MICO|nr:hypothetical protein [Brevibacterium daeguense]
MVATSAQSLPARRPQSPADTDPDVVTPPPANRAVPEVLASAVGMIRLLRAGRLHSPRQNIGRTLRFADGSSAAVYRETRVDDGRAAEPALLVVGFVLRGIRGRAHVAFRVESWLNTPMFVGFPGFASKLWMRHDESSRYRGIYEWDGAERAAAYVRALSWVLGVVSVRGSIRAHIVPGLHRDDVLARPELLGDEGADRWWRPATPVGET